MTKELRQIYRQFPTEQSCVEFLEGVLWPKGSVCPYCKAQNVVKLKNENRYHCNPCNTSFSITVKTLFHHTRIDLQKWFLAVYLHINLRDVLTARGLAEQIGVTKDSAWLLITKLKQHSYEQFELIDAVYKKIDSLLNNKTD